MVSEVRQQVAVRWQSGGSQVRTNKQKKLILDPWMSLCLFSVATRASLETVTDDERVQSEPRQGDPDVVHMRFICLPLGLRWPVIRLCDSYMIWEMFAKEVSE